MRVADEPEEINLSNIAAGLRDIKRELADFKNNVCVQLLAISGSLAIKIPEQKEPPKLVKYSSKILEIMADGQIYSSYQLLPLVNKYVAEKGAPEVNILALSSTLSNLTSQGKIKRVARNIYQIA